MANIKNILLIGRTGNGKSTLANVLTGTNIFTESADSVSETKSIKTSEFEINERVKYCVIDTVGVGDTQLDTREVLYKLGEVARFIEKDGLNQIFFVTSGRFTNEEVEAYKLLSSIIFDQKVFEYTTIIRTNFPEFEDENACERDRNKLRNESGELSQIFNQSGIKVIYVNNPPLVGRSSAINKELREESKTRLTAYLGSVSHKNYMPSNLSTLNDRIRDYMTEKERLEKELKEKEKMMKEKEKEYTDKINGIQANLNKRIKEIEDEKDKEIRKLENDLDAKIKKLEKEGKANEDEINRLREKTEEDKKRVEDDSKNKKEVSKKKASDEEKKSSDDNNEVIKKLENRIKELEKEKENSKEKVAEEVEKHIQKARKDSVVTVAKTATEVAVLGTVTAVCAPVGVVLTAA